MPMVATGRFDCIYFELLSNMLCHTVDFHLLALAFHLPICEFQWVLIEPGS